MAKEKMLLARTEAAQKLLALAGQLEQGALVFQNRKIPVPDQVRLAIDAAGDELEFELTWKPAAAIPHGEVRLQGPDEPDTLW